MPFGPYVDFDDCVAKNGDKSNPRAYCAAIEQEIKSDSATATMRRVRLQIVPVVDPPIEFVAGGDPAVIVDIDGVLLTNENEPYSDMIENINEVMGQIMVVSGRLEADREATEAALVAGGLRDHRLYLRPDDTVDVVAHKAAVAADLLDTYDVVLAIDNDENARTAYAGLGIDARSPGDFEEIEGTESDEAGEVEVEVDDTESDDMPTDAMATDFHTMMVVEGVWTGDGRYIEEGALDWRALPLPLMATNRTTEGHMDAVLIGQITTIERMGREIHGSGSFVKTDDPTVVGLQRLIANGELRGISVDLDAVEYEVLFPTMVDGEQMDPPIDDEGNAVVPMEDPKMRVTGARIMGATVVPFPAFQEAYIESTAALTASLSTRCDVSGWINHYASFDDIDFVPPQGAREEAQRGLDWRSEFGRGGTEIGIARARDIANGRNLSPETVNRMVSYFARHEIDKQATGWSPGEDGFPSNGRIAWALWGGDPGMAWANKVKRQMDSREERGSIVASGHPITPPIVPPASWFTNPDLSRPTPLTVDDDGRIYGHLAVWGQCHIGFADRCVEPPTSQTRYAHYLTGEILCDDGSRVPVGQITMGAGHASHRANASQAAAHYDNTAMAVADVTTGEDAFGIWVSGALRPDLNPARVRELMASDVSGDWRRIGGNLELVAVLAVNVPGFPKIRVTEVDGLVASISLPAFATTSADTHPLSSVADRIAASIGRSRRDRARDVIARVNGPRVAGLRSRIKGDR